MIPLQLTLKNFLSYREATLDFRGLHTACICGANGAGKSSLLEAITWVIWGKSRTASDDDIVHAGEKNVRVDFSFICNQQTYRVIRTRQRGRSSVLEFQVESEEGKFRSLSGKGVKATQDRILSDLRLDYDTFINSSYLRQGKADDFMLRRPGERKQILADLLKLNRYEELAVQAKDASRQFKGQAEQLEQVLQPLEEELGKRKGVSQQQGELAQELAQLQEQQEQQQQKLQGLQARQQQRQTWQQQLTWQENQYQNLTQDCLRLQQDGEALHAEIEKLEAWLQQEGEITTAYAQLQNLRQEEESFAAKFQAYQDAQQQRQELETQLNQQENELRLEMRQLQTQLSSLQKQEEEIQGVMSQATEIAAALAKLNSQRQRLQELDNLQLQVSPLLQRRLAVQSELEKVQARLTAKLEQLHSSAQELNSQMAQLPQVQKSAATVEIEIGELEKKRVYQQRVREKGEERKSFQERLQEHQRTYEKQLGETQQKLAMLKIEGAACPLCERELDEHYRQRVMRKTETQQEDIQGQLWVIREQMAVCDSELQLLRGEYAKLNRELAPYDNLMQQKGQLEAQLEANLEKQQRLAAISEEQEKLEQSLIVGNYALELHSELAGLNQELERLNYDEQTHALVRGEVESWRWAEIRQAKLDDAQRRMQGIEAQKPELLAQIAALENSIANLRHSSPIQQQIQAVEEQISDLGYDRDQHNSLIASLRQANDWQLRYQQLQQAKQQYPQLTGKLEQLEILQQSKIADREAMQQQLEEITTQISQITDNSSEINTLEQQIYQRRQNLDGLLAQQGRLAQQVSHLNHLQQQYEDSTQRLQAVQKQCRVYQELAQAFGKNGIQALMIENILPQLEAETNQILARLTGNQLHVQFLTQKVGRSSRSRKKDAKLIDTLEILIADARGTRAYETYSGGEAFRINFAIRLALARILAQRAGTSLQMLIVDEGFGTQDVEGCDRLIAAINAIAPDFSCILTVTHMPQFKEAFQTRIEVHKTNQGSQLSLST